MTTRMLRHGARLALALMSVGWAADAPRAASGAGGSLQQTRVTQAQRDAAAAGSGLVVQSLDAAMATATMAAPGSAPHYFGPYANYANSPLRLADATVDITGAGTGAAATATVDLATGAVTAVAVTAPGTGYLADGSTLVTISSTATTAAGAAATAVVDPLTGEVTAIVLDAPGTGYVSPGIRKFVNRLPGLGPGAANDLGQYIPVAVPDTTTYPGSDYYEIAVVQYREQLHSDLPPTLLRGYVQLATAVVPGAGVPTVPLTGTDGLPILLPGGQQAVGVDRAHSLGPAIVATRDRPVRILFRNLLPSGQGGDLFLPVDTTVMGAGMGPDMGGMADPDPRNPMCGMTPKPMGCFAENRATLHLHGGITPWISDGTPHQWITPAGDSTSYPKGVSVTSVPDMPDPGPGAMTFFYTNQQSARLMFYHDHAWGITRLNVYAGEAAAYVISDAAEGSLVANGIIPGPADTLPLIVQDKTFVPPEPQLAAQDPTWDMARWGGLGSLWVPHVYMPAQNPGDASGVNQFGRWAYGPWFWPPTSNIDYPPIANPYYDPACDPSAGWCEPPLVPGTPWLSMGMEAFNDTPTVNGTVYPTVTLEPKTYRFRILNAANDRFFNLQLYVADASGTEVALNAAEVQAALADPAGVFPTPDTALSPPGPSFVQIGTEGGFLPSPVVVPPQPITWITDPTVFNAGNVDKHSLLLGPAERADVIVDLSAFAGQTLILYNDAPAAFPARDPRYDYYTGNADLTSTGGAPSTPPGFGPNTRTVMQIKVSGSTPAAAFDLAALRAAFAHKPDGTGVFEASQHPIVVGQEPYNAALGTAFQANGPRAGLVQIYDELFAFDTVSGVPLTMPLQRKAIQDEMGEAFEKEYGRMSGNLGLEAPNAQAGQQQNLILYPYVNPASEVLAGIVLPPGVDVTPITTTDDGTQLWKITHNGVDTHPIHFHLFDIQLVNRVGWDGIVRRPDANELGWKDTVRISPLEDTIVAMRPVVPKLPFGLPHSVRPLNPMMPLGSPDGFNSVDANGNPISPALTNVMTDFGWEYVWHCHILSHEEMDMMRPMAVSVATSLPYPPTGVTVAPAAGGVDLAWLDATPVSYAGTATWGDPSNEIGFRVERAPIGNNGKTGAYVSLGTTLANQARFRDTTADPALTYSYRIVAVNAAGESVSAPAGGPVPAPPQAPTNVVATVAGGPSVTVTWRDNASNEAYFVLERSVDGGAFAYLSAPPARSNTGTVTFTDPAVSAGHTYQYRVSAVNGGGSSAPAVSNAVTVVSPPLAPSGLAGTAVRSGKKANVTLTWVDGSTDETGFELQRATNASFTVGFSTSTLAANTVTVTQTGLYRGVTYYYRIRAVNGGGASAWSNVATVITP
ncbi:Fibronectin type III domain protein [Anaeromyxobacter sp. K]|uniref:fibronectin type III domain-containing protein n=1 Tax=Anaeromyxobacter sp. (strain K) TaxID=447217 RepID=UPI00017BE337|nr:fibronectin type III domain-containing protein [Anaeromyxobacter sp. K]ACG72197.1 Fibronectin type III domain protein [Anaeromyxobacter sp. K]